MTDTAIYARISADRRDGAGVERQLEDCRLLASERGWEAVEFVDNSISASRFERRARPAYGAMLEAVEAGEVSRIVVYKSDRLYRQPRELEDLIRLADTGDVQILAVEGGEMDLSTSAGRYFARGMVNGDAKSSDDTSDRILRQKRQQRDKGRPTGSKRPFGWRNGMVPEPEEAALIAQAVDDLLAGASLSEIARQWTDAGVERPGGSDQPWSAAVVSGIVRNPRHAGLLAHRDYNKRTRKYGKPSVLREGSWPAIIPREKWEKLIARLDGNGSHLHAPKRLTVLTGLLHCHHCDDVMFRTGNKRGGRPGWQCRPGHTYISGEVEDWITEAVLIAGDTGALTRFLQPTEADESVQAAAELAEIEQRLHDLGTSFGAGRIPLAAFEAATAELETRQAELRRTVHSNRVQSVLEPYAGAPGLLRQWWPSLTISQQRAIVNALIARIVVLPSRGLRRFDPERVEITWKA